MIPRIRTNWFDVIFFCCLLLYTVTCAQWPKREELIGGFSSFSLSHYQSSFSCYYRTNKAAIILYVLAVVPHLFTKPTAYRQSCVDFEMDEWVKLRGNIPSLSLVSLGTFHNSKYEASNECLGEYINNSLIGEI